MRTRRRTQLRAASAAALALALAVAAGGCGDDGDSGDGTIQLTFTWWGSDSRHAYTQELIDMFTAEHPNIEIQPTFSDFDGYWDALATATAGGNAPDIIQMEERFVREYVANGQLLDLNTVSDVLDTSQLDPAALAAGEIDGGLYTIATGFNAFAIVADPQIVQDAGFEMPDDTTWSWQDYIDLTVDISEAGGGDYFGAQAFGTNEALFNIYARQQGEALYNADGTLGFTAETLAEFWDLALEQIERGGTPGPEETVEIGATGPDQSLLATNRGAFGTWWTNQLGTLSGSAGRELVLLRQPGESTGVQPGMYLKPAMSWSISANTEHPREAAMFVDFLLNSPEAGEKLLNDRGVPANPTVRDAIADQLPPAEQQVADFMSELAPTLGEAPPPPPTGAGEVVDIMQRIYEEMLFGNLTTTEAANEFIEQVQDAIAT
ncbi:MAG TPA: extracellular solute-binding protein [Natronosporangium sp.]